jgi:hypothetical protein
LAVALVEGDVGVVARDDAGAPLLPFENDGHHELDFVVEQPDRQNTQAMTTQVRAIERRIRTSL